MLRRALFSRPVVHTAFRKHLQTARRFHTVIQPLHLSQVCQTRLNRGCIVKNISISYSTQSNDDEFEPLEEIIKASDNLKRAKLSFQEGDLEDAIRCVSKEIEQNPHYDVYVLRAQFCEDLYLHLESSRKEAEIEESDLAEQEVAQRKKLRDTILNDLDELLTFNEYREQILVRKARILYNTFHDPQASMKVLKEAEEMSPDSHTVLMSMGQWYSQEKKPEEAWKYYKKALGVTNKDDHQGIYIRMAMAFINAEKYKDALSVVNLPFVKREDLPYYKFKISIFNRWEETKKPMKREEMREWRETLDSAINALGATLDEKMDRASQSRRDEQYDQMSRFYQERSYCNTLLDLHEEAVRDADKIIEYEPQRIDEGLSHKARALFSMGKQKEAMQILDKAISLADGTDRVYHHLALRARLRNEMKNFAESTGDCKRVIDGGATAVPKSLYNQMKTMRAENLIELSRYDEAEDAINALIHERGENSWELFCLRAIVYHDLQKARECVRDFERAMNIAPRRVEDRYPQVYGMMGSTLRVETEGKDDEQTKAKAEYYLKKAIERDASNTEWWIQMALLHLSDHRYEKSIEDCGHILAIDNKCADAFYIRACARGNKKQFEGALKDIDETLFLDPKFEGATEIKKKLLEDRRLSYSEAGIPVDAEGKPSQKWVEDAKKKKALGRQDRPQIDGK
ncbi:TPR repeat-containing protein [Planoprotostelium fungivorum]|uniref:TPR repeat-containing protein n=1 Tax=Planoprotostelium fungivorum TaxID=1890364 RepID=A0A2P6MW83_9EUKA|nr:TPR repeat-containing protein [Planoprotostelium fungivorum]PRP80327.1 TPR repeat-containing protein [Planoprotostelium fungivorum]